MTENAKENSEVLNENAVAALFEVQPRTIRLWRRTKGLPHYKLCAKVVRFRRPDVLTWLEKFRRAMIVRS